MGGKEGRGEEEGENRGGERVKCERWGGDGECLRERGGGGMGSTLHLGPKTSWRDTRVSFLAL